LPNVKSSFVVLQDFLKQIAKNLDRSDEPLEISRWAACRGLDSTELARSSISYAPLHFVCCKACCYIDYKGLIDCSTHFCFKCFSSIYIMYTKECTYSWVPMTSL